MSRSSLRILLLTHIICSFTYRYAFLTLTVQILYFYPSGSLSAQLENCLLSFLGALFSFGYCNLFLYFAVLANRAYPGNSIIDPPGSEIDGSAQAPVTKHVAAFETPSARAACGVGLAVLALFCGYVRSTSPRLLNFARITGFMAIWLLTDASNILEVRPHLFFFFFFLQSIRRR